jgi:hypothetical protein
MTISLHSRGIPRLVTTSITHRESTIATMVGGEAVHDYRLSVDRRDLRYGVELLRQARKVRLSHGEAILGYDGECLTLEAGDKMSRAYATGSWPGNARTSAALFAALVKLSPDAGPVTLVCDGQHVDFDQFRFGCRWQPVAIVSRHLPPAHDWLQRLAISYTQSRSQIRASGLTADVHDAHDKLARLIARAAQTLVPLGIATADIQELVDRSLEERFIGVSGKRNDAQ